MNIKRTKQIMFRVHIAEKIAIEHTARQAGLSTADYCRTTALNKKLTARLTPDELQAFITIGTIKLNFVRIANLIRERKDIAGEVRATIDQLNILISRLK